MSQSVLYLVPDLLGPPGGIVRYSQMVCRALLESGYKVAIVALADSAQAASAATVQFPGVSYRPCQGARQEFVRRALSTVIQRRPAIILVGHPNFSTLGWFLARVIGASLVSFIYGIDVWTPMKSLRRLALQRSDNVISISRFTARQAAYVNGLLPEKVRILHNCLDPQFEQQLLSKRNKLNLSMLTVARMSKAERYKGHDYVIQSLPTLLSQFPQLRYHIVGDGNDRARLESLVKQNGVTDAVRFHGVVSDKALQQLYANASIYIMPSQAEGFGFVFLEAMAQGVPVIGGNVDATPEVIVDGKTGYLVNPTSVEEIAAAISRLLANSELRHQMGQAAQRHVAEKFSYAQFRQKLVSYLSELQAIPQTKPDTV